MGCVALRQPWCGFLYSCGCTCPQDPGRGLCGVREGPWIPEGCLQAGVWGCGPVGSQSPGVGLEFWVSCLFAQKLTENRQLVSVLRKPTTGRRDSRAQSPEDGSFVQGPFSVRPEHTPGPSGLALQPAAQGEGHPGLMVSEKQPLDGQVWHLLNGCSGSVTRWDNYPVPHRTPGL